MFLLFPGMQVEAHQLLSAAKDDIEGMIIDAMPELDRFSGTYAIFDQAETPLYIYKLEGQSWLKSSNVVTSIGQPCPS